jgi:hypothetical protein
MLLTLATNPQIFLTQAAKRYPGCWNALEQWRNNIVTDPNVPAYCFVPSTFCDMALHQILGSRNYSMHDVYCLTGLAAWRVTQGIYRFNDDLYNELVQMEVGALPADVLNKLPEWCIYLELKEDWATGAFVYIDRNMNGGLEQLSILLVTGEGDFERLVPYFIPLSGSLMDGILKQKEFIEQHFAKTGRAAPEYKVKSVFKCLSSIASMALYICCVNADISGTPVRPKAVKTKRGPRWFPPDKPTMWEVGYRVGPVLGRSLRLASEREQELGRAGVRPHVRRAHHHHYWVGTDENKEKILKWLSPIFVNVETPEDLATTIRPVL